MNDKSPVIYKDIGDGKTRRFFLGYDELTMIRTETGRGFYSLYSKFAVDAEPKEVKAVVRLALIGGGEAPAKASELVDYYCQPPRSLKDAYLLAYECLSAAWNGTEKSKSGHGMSVEDMDDYFVELEASIIKNGGSADILKGKSFAEIQRILTVLRGEKEVPAPDGDIYLSIKMMSDNNKPLGGTK